MMFQWAQELLGYHFTIIRQPARMMVDVNAILQWFINIITQHIYVAALLHNVDYKSRPLAYIDDFNSIPNATNPSCIIASGFGPYLLNNISILP